MFSLRALLGVVEATYDELYGDRRWWCHAHVKKVTLRGWRAYVELVEVGETGELLAQCKAIVWDATLMESLARTVGRTGADELVDMELAMSVSVHFHVVWWFSLYVHAFSAEHVLGQEQLRLEEVRKRLRAAWLWDRNKQKTLGDPPWRLAVITSPQSAGWEDFVAIMDASPWQWMYDLFPAIMHGPGAVASLEEAWSRLVNQSHQVGQVDQQDQSDQSDQPAYHEYDAVLLLRWGGGKEWMLWTQDETIVSLACRSPRPVMSAVGHTQDRSLLDEVVWRSFSTPSDAAHSLVDQMARTAQRADDLYLAVQWQLAQRVHGVQLEIERWYRDILYQWRDRVRTYQHTLTSWYEYIMDAGPQRLLEKWYALVRDPVTHKLLGPAQQAALSVGDQVIVELADRQFLVTLQEALPFDVLSRTRPPEK